MSSAIHCRFTGQIKYPAVLRHSEKAGRTWCRMEVMVAAGSSDVVRVLCFGGCELDECVRRFAPAKKSQWRGGCHSGSGRT